jgi:hypothetical protein
MEVVWCQNNMALGEGRDVGAGYLTFVTARLVSRAASPEKW